MEKTLGEMMLNQQKSGGFRSLILLFADLQIINIWLMVIPTCLNRAGTGDALSDMALCLTRRSSAWRQTFMTGTCNLRQWFSARPIVNLKAVILGMGYSCKNGMWQFFTKPTFRRGGQNPRAVGDTRITTHGFLDRYNSEDLLLPALSMPRRS